jgi:hypothetical protein
MAENDGQSQTPAREIPPSFHNRGYSQSREQGMASAKMIAPSRGINNIRAWKILFLDAAQPM